MSKGYIIKAAVLVGLSKIKTQGIKLPSLDSKEVLVKVEMSGVCGTDLHLYSSERPFGDIGFGGEWTYPTILGHENYGIIAEIGKDSDMKDASGQPLNIGDRVSFTSVARGDKSNVLLNGWARGWASYSVCSPGSQFFKYEKDVPDEVITLTEPMSIAQRAVMRAQQAADPYSMRGFFPGSSVVVQGLGPIGLLTLIMAKIAGAEHVIGIDMSDYRLDMAKKFGADYIIDLKDFKNPTDLYAEVNENSIYGMPPDVVFEAAGAPIAFHQAITMVKHGGTVVEVGHWTEREKIPVDPFAICIKDLDIVGCAGLSCAWPDGMFELSRRILRANYKKYNLKEIVTHKFPVEKAEDAIALARTGQCMKPVIIP